MRTVYQVKVQHTNGNGESFDFIPSRLYSSINKALEHSHGVFKRLDCVLTIAESNHLKECVKQSGKAVHWVDAKVFIVIESLPVL